MLQALRTFFSNEKRSPQHMSGSIGAQIISPTGSAGWQGPKLGTAELLAAYNHLPWLRAVVSKAAESVGTINWRLYAATDDNPERSFIRHKSWQRSSFYQRDKILKQHQLSNEVEEITDHPILDLLENGNPFLQGQNIMEVTQEHLDLVGESFWIMELNMFRMPVALWPVPPDWVKQTPSSESPFYHIDIGVQRFMIPANVVICFKKVDPKDPYGRGSGMAKALGDELQISENASKHLSGFFLNRAKPDIIISADGMRQEDTKRFEELWLQKFQSFRRAYLPAFINRAIEVKELGQSFDNMQMVELRKQQRDIIIEVYGFPPEKFGILAASNRATINAADMFWTKDIVLPRMELLRATLQRILVPMFDDRLILDFESPIVQDKEHQLSVMKQAVWAFDKNEWRQEADMPDLGADGELFMMADNQALFENGEVPGRLEPSAPPAPGEASSPADVAAVNNAVQLALKRSMPIIMDEVTRQIEDSGLKADNR